MPVIQTLPEDTIRHYLEQQGGETDATVGHLLTTFRVDDGDSAGRRRIKAALAQTGVQVDRPIAFLAAGETIHLSLAVPDEAGVADGSGESPLNLERELRGISTEERRAGW